MEGKDTTGNTGIVSRRLKEKLAVEDIYGVEESEEVDTEKIEDCEIIDTEGNVISSTDSSDIGDWEKRHNEIEEQREKIRNRVRKTRSGNGVIRKAKPKPTISDTGHKQVRSICPCKYQKYKSGFFYRKSDKILYEKSWRYTKLDFA